MPKAWGAALAMPSIALMSRFWVMQSGGSPCPSAIPSTRTGCFAPSRARSLLVTTTAAAPSLSREQSKRRSGSAMRRDAWWSSRLMGLACISA